MATVAAVAPLELLGEMLREDRAQGFTFNDVFDEDVAFATRRQSGWRDAIEGTRDAWRDSWHGWPGPRSAVTLDLADDTRENVPSPVLPG